MCRKLVFLLPVVVVLALVNSGTAGVLVHYSFDNGQGEDFPDSIEDDTGSVTFQKVEETGTVTYGGPNPIYNPGGTSAHFTHNAALWRDVVTGPDILDLSGPEYTVEMFIKVNEWSTSRGHDVIFKKMPQDYVMEFLSEDGEGSLRFSHFEEEPASTIRTDAGTIDLDQWYHIAFVFDSGEDEPQKIYIDGLQAAGGGVSDLAPGSDGPVGIAAMTRPAYTRQDWLAANIDEFRISDEALEPSEFLLNQAYDEGKASRPRPRGSARDLCPEEAAELCWTPGRLASSHDVYFSTDYDDVADAATAAFEGNQEPNCYEPTGIELEKTYYWRIDEINDSNAYKWEGDVWQFSTSDGTASDPSPSDGFKGVAPNDVVLIWTPGCLASVHDVYLGTGYTDVRDAITLSAEYEGSQNPGYDPGDLEKFTTYYWRVDEVNGPNTWEGEVWSFTTGLGGLLMYYKFDGSQGSALPSPITDDSSNNIQFTKYLGAGGSAKYGESSPVIYTSSASADFDPCSGLYRLDTGDNDMLRLDGRQYTIEMWIKPQVLNDDYIDSEDDLTLVGKIGSWQIKVEGPGGDNTYRWYHAGDHDDDMPDGSAVVEEWAHIAFVYDNDDPDNDRMKSYLNGLLVAEGSISQLNPADTNAVTIAMTKEQDGSYAGFFDGLIDELRIFDIALTPCEFLLSPGPEWASCPSPGDGERSVDPNVVLSWTAGTSADTHDVYLGTDYNDVKDGVTVDPVYEGNYEPNEFDPCGPGAPLELGQMYYWRVDELGAGGPWEGVVWSFTVRSPLADPNLRLWYKFDEREGGDVLDSSGREFHSSDGDADGQWDPQGGRFDGALECDDDIGLAPDTFEGDNVLSTINTAITVSVWLKDAFRRDDGQVEDNTVFDGGDGGESATYRIQGFVVDETRLARWRAGNDTNDVMTWDLDGVNPETLEGWHHWVFIKDEVAGYMSMYFDGELADVNNVVDSTLANLQNDDFKVGAVTWHGADLMGWIDDFRLYDRALTAGEVVELFRGGEVELAWAPKPRDGESEVPRDANMVWKPGDYTVQHDVYFGTAWDDVNDANTASDEHKSRRDANTFDPCEILELGTTYYWRIDEVNDSNINSPWKGHVWSFTAANFLIVDDMETYNTTTNRIYHTYDDGYVNGTGAELDLGTEPRNPDHGRGSQSMKYLYDSADSKGWDLDYYSEISVDALKANLKIQSRDWTQADVKILTMFFYGDPGNDANEQMYVGLTDTSGAGSYAQVNYGFYGEDMNDIREAEWHQWEIALPDFTDVDESAVGELYIGFGIRGNPNPGGTPGGKGTVFFDNIRLSSARCIPWRVKPRADFTDDCIVTLADVGYMADDWLNTDACLPTLEPAVGPVAYWDYEEGDGNTVNDSINNYDGTAEGNYEWVAGRIGSYAMEFSGGWVAVPDDGNTPLLRAEGDRLGLAAWIKVAEHTGNWAELLLKGRDNYETYGLEISDNAQGLTFFVRDANLAIYDLDSENALPEDEWLHIAGTYDGTNLTSYLNGQVEMTKVIGSIDLYVDANDGLGMAGRWNDSTGRFHGSMDEVQVYSYALSAEEVAYIATETSGYVPLLSQANLYDLEPAGSKAINFRDLDLLLDEWLDEKLWPPE